jgi:hypothetical protein
MANGGTIAGDTKWKILLFGAIPDTQVLLEKLHEIHDGPAGPFHVAFVTGFVENVQVLEKANAPIPVYLYPFAQYRNAGIDCDWPSNSARPSDPLSLSSQLSTPETTHGKPPCATRLYDALRIANNFFILGDCSRTSSALLYRLPLSAGSGAASCGSPICETSQGSPHSTSPTSPKTPLIVLVCPGIVSNIPLIMNQLALTTTNHGCDLFFSTQAAVGVQDVLDEDPKDITLDYTTTVSRLVQVYQPRYHVIAGNKYCSSHSFSYSMDDVTQRLSARNSRVGRFLTLAPCRDGPSRGSDKFVHALSLQPSFTMTSLDWQRERPGFVLANPFQHLALEASTEAEESDNYVSGTTPRRLFPPTSPLTIREYDDDPRTGRNVFHNDGAQLQSQSQFFREYRVSIDESNRVHVSSHTFYSNLSSISFWQHLSQTPIRFATELFMPVGYPYSVREGYLSYQIYDSIQGLSSYLRAVLCSAQVLQAAGVGDANATAIMAALTWALKDGLGMIGGLIFSYGVASHLDAYVKEFRLFADVINDVGMLLDMLAPYVPRADLIWISSAATLCKVMCGIAAGATKSSITQHFALQGNMADLNAKEATQETLVNLIGMVCGVTLARYLSQLEAGNEEGDTDRMGYRSWIPCISHDSIQWMVFTILTLLHIWSNWKGVSLLRLETLNRERTKVVLCAAGLWRALVPDCEALRSEKYAELGLLRQEMLLETLQKCIENIPRPNDMRESLASSTWDLLMPTRLVLHARLKDMIAIDWTATKDFVNEKYVVVLSDRGRALVCLLTGAAPMDELKAFVHGLLILKCLDSIGRKLKLGDVGQRSELVRQTQQQINMLFNPSWTSQSAQSENTSEPLSFLKELRAKGWDVDGRLYLGFPRRRSQWMPEKAD